MISYAQCIASFVLRLFLAQLALAVAIPTIVGGNGQANVPGTGWTMERVLREQATKTVRPEYPETALKHHQVGVAVVNIHLATDGSVSRARILEAPSEAIGQSVCDAVLQWRFNPILGAEGKPEAVSGKLTFYFEIIGSKGFALDPQDVGYVGHWPRSHEYRVQ